MQRKKILLLSLAVIIALASIFAYLKIPGLSLTQQKQLKLSDFPQAFKEKTVIVIGDNSSEIEKQAAEQIAEYLKQTTKNQPEIISSKDFEKFKYGYNLIILGTPKSNPVLKEVYEMTNATRVNESFPGEGKGILEILRNPWNEEKALLLVEGSDEWGVKTERLMINSISHAQVSKLSVCPLNLTPFKRNNVVVPNRSIVVHGSPGKPTIIKIPISTNVANDLLEGKRCISLEGDLNLLEISTSPPAIILSYTPSLEGRYVSFVLIDDELVGVQIFSAGQIPNSGGVK